MAAGVKHDTMECIITSAVPPPTQIPIPNFARMQPPKPTNIDYNAGKRWGDVTNPDTMNYDWETQRAKKTNTHLPTPKGPPCHFGWDVIRHIGTFDF